MNLLLGDTSAARKHAEAAIALNGGLVSSLPLVIAYKTSFDITEQEGDTKAALEQYKKYASAERGYREDVAAREMAYKVVMAQSIQQGQELEMLKMKKEVLTLKQRVRIQMAQSSRTLSLMMVVRDGSFGYGAF